MHITITGPRQQIEQLLSGETLPGALRRDLHEQIWIEADWSNEELSIWPAVVSEVGCKMHLPLPH